jgi:hypothetical protein
MDQSTLQYNIINARGKLGIGRSTKASSQFPIFNESGFYKFQNLSIFKLDEYKGDIFDLPVVDILWINQNMEADKMVFHEKWEQSLVLIDGMLPWYKSYELEKQFQAKGFQVYNMHRHGAYWIDLNRVK